MLQHRQGELISKTIIVGGIQQRTFFNGSFRQNINKETSELDHSVDQMYVTGVYTRVYQTAVYSTHSFHQHMEHSSEQTINKVTKKNLNKFQTLKL